jgi:hypothetical protein
MSFRDHVPTGIGNVRSFDKLKIREFLVALGGVPSPAKRERVRVRDCGSVSTIDPSISWLQ